MVVRDSPDVSVIIPAKDAAATLGDQLKALAAQVTSHAWELVVVADAADDDTLRVLEEYRSRIPGLRTVRVEEGQGAGHARNLGAQNARGRFILYCDADDIVAPGWIEALARRLETDHAVGGPLEEESLNTAETRMIRYPLVTDHLHRVLGVFPRAVTANCGVRRETFRELGGFDISYEASEDTEFFIRLQVRGYRLGFVPDALVHYRHERNLRMSLRKIFRWGVTRARLYRDYRAHGGERPSGWLGRWMGLALTSWHLLGGRERRLRWLAVGVRSLGRLVGSLRYRVLYL